MMHAKLNRNASAGYSLVEVLIGMVILMIALASAFMLTLNTSKLMEQNQRLAAAASLAEYKIEELRNTDFASVATGSDGGTIDSMGNAGGDYTRAWAVADDTPVAGLKTVVVTVSWNQWGDTRIYTLSGVIGS